MAAFFSGKEDGLCYTSAYGYIWHEGSPWLTKAKDLWRTCGSCTIIYYRPDELPAEDFEHRNPSQHYIFQQSHRQLPLYARAQGKQFATLPFPSTVYVLGTGENHSRLTGVGISWKRTVEGWLRLPKKIDERLRNEFCIG